MQFFYIFRFFPYLEFMLPNVPRLDDVRWRYNNERSERPPVNMREVSSANVAGQSLLDIVVER